MHTYWHPVSSARTLQHPALLQCLAQCSEVTPYLLVMEFCPLVGHTFIIKFYLFSSSHIPYYFLSWFIVVWFIHKRSEQLTTSFPVSSQGDLKSYLCSCRVADSETPDPLILQRMACDIASGLLQLHKYNFIHRCSVSVSPALFTFINLNVNALERNRYARSAPCWSLPATTSWCCLSICHKLQHQWFCCRGRAPIALFQPCGCHSNQSGAAGQKSSLCGWGEIRQNDLVKSVSLHGQLRINRTWHCKCTHFMMWFNSCCGYIG